MPSLRARWTARSARFACSLISLSVPLLCLLKAPAAASWAALPIPAARSWRM